METDAINATLTLLIGLLGFLGLHSLSLVARPWRDTQVTRWGERPWKGVYSAASLLFFYLIVQGYAAARVDPIVVWVPPLGMRHGAILLTLPAFILLAAAYVPGNRIKTVVGHPMLAGTKAWALGHLLANGNLADVMLFGGFLAWAIADFISARRRDRAAGKTYPAGPASRTVITVVIGTVAWLVFARFLHLPLIGVSPFTGS